MRNIKLIVITPSFYPESGGVATHTYNLYKRLVKKGLKVVIITANHESKEYKEENLEGMKIYRLPYQFKVSNTPISFKWKRQIKEIIKKEKPDIINAHTPVPFISDVICRVANKLKIPFIIKYHHGGSMMKGSFPMDILIWIYEKIFLKRLLKKSTLIITSSDFITKGFMKSYINKTITITPAVDTDLFKSLNLNSKNTILFVANLKKSESYKGLNYLLEAISQVKDKISNIKLHIVGEGDYFNYYKEIVRKLNLENNVNFIGRLTGKELVREYNKSNILVLPSLMESFGMVLTEAMACKKPVIGSKIGGIPYVIDDGKNGLLVPPRDPQALADAIIKILSNTKLAKQMGENGYKKVKENFTWDKKVDETLNSYKEVLK